MSNHEENDKSRRSELSIELGKRILSVIDEIDHGFKKVMNMYTIAFYMGLIMIVISAISTIYSKDNYFSLIFGGIGIIDVVSFFIFKPAEDLQRSRGNLAQLVSAFLTWYNDINNWTILLKKEISKDKDSYIVAFREASMRSVLNTISIMKAIEIFVASRLSASSKEELESVTNKLQEEIEEKHLKISTNEQKNT